MAPYRFSQREWRDPELRKAVVASLPPGTRLLPPEGADPERRAPPPGYGIPASDQRRSIEALHAVRQKMGLPPLVSEQAIKAWDRGEWSDSTYARWQPKSPDQMPKGYIDLSPYAYERAAREQLEEASAQEAVAQPLRNAAAAVAEVGPPRPDYGMHLGSTAPATGPGAYLRRLEEGESFSPGVSLEQLQTQFSASSHQRMKTAHDYLRVLRDTGSLTPTKWGVLEEVAVQTPGFAEALNLAAPSQVKAAAVSAGVQATQQRMAGQMPATVPAVAQAIQNAAPRQSWTLASGVSNGNDTGKQRRDQKGYGLAKLIKADVDGATEAIMRIPYIVEKWKDEARNLRFEQTRNPTREDVNQIAYALLSDASEAGLDSGTIVLAPRRTPGAMRNQPMWHVAQAMKQMSGGRFEYHEALVREREAPTRTSIHERSPSEDLSKIYSGAVPVITANGLEYVSSFSGDSILMDRFDEMGIGRNRSFSEDYKTLAARRISGDRKVILLDDSVNQGSSQLAAALRLHEANPGLRITPMTYWGFAGGAVKPKGALSRSMTAEDLIALDQANLNSALRAHRQRANAFVDTAEKYAGHNDLKIDSARYANLVL